jgi:hypothetical protein
MRKQSLMVILAPLFGNLRKYRKEQGRLLLYFITEYISDGRLIKIGEGKDAEYTPLIRQSDTVTYDVVVDESPTAPDQKAQTWMVLQQMIPFISNLGVPPQVWMEVLKYSPLPSTFADNVSRIMQQEQQKAAQGPPPDPKMVEVQAKIAADQARLKMDIEKHQLELEQMKADIEKTRADALKSVALAEAAEIGPQLEQYKHELSLLSGEIDHQRETMKMAVGAQQDHALEQQAHANQMAQQEQAAQLEPPLQPTQ